MRTSIFIIIVASFLQCTPQASRQGKGQDIYTSKNLIITQVSDNAFIHITFLQTEDFGLVPCNGMLVRQGDEVVVFDTPNDDSTSVELIQWIRTTLQCSIIAVVPTHFHNDCLGGLKAFHDAGIPSYAHEKTLALAAQHDYAIPMHGFVDSMRFPLTDSYVVAAYLGEGHTVDNTVGYFPSEKVLFGGCLVKELNATKGYLGDANLQAWSSTVEQVKKAFPEAEIIIPGHGAHGDTSLLNYTIQLFETD